MGTNEVLKLALEALEHPGNIYHIDCPRNTAITALREALAEQPAQQEPVAKVCHDLDGHIGWNPNLRQLPDEGAALYTSPPTLSLAQRSHECSRSHPHENMNAMCELRTEIARLTNENARLKAQPQQEPFGYLYEGTAEHTRHKTVFEKTRAERFETRWWREIGPCYTSPPAQRTWVGLTDGEWMNIVNKDHAWYGQRPDEVAHEVAKLVEAKLKEKNT